MGRIERTFNSLKEKGKKALVIYLTAGDPSLEQTREIIIGLDAAGRQYRPSLFSLGDIAKNHGRIQTYRGIRMTACFDQSGNVSLLLVLLYVRFEKGFLHARFERVHLLHPSSCLQDPPQDPTREKTASAGGEESVG